jgi:hypothetical protein
LPENNYNSDKIEIMKLMVQPGLAIVFAIFSSCVKDIEESITTIEENEDLVQSTSYYFTDQTYYKINYFYDDKGRVIKKEEEDPKKVFRLYETVEYDNDQINAVQKGSEQGKIGEYRFSFNKGMVSSIEYWLINENGLLKRWNKRTFEYDNQYITKTITENFDDSNHYYTLFLHKNQNVIAVKVIDFRSQEVVEETTYEYDNNPNPFLNKFPEYYGLPISSSKNNVVFQKTSYKNSNKTDTELSFHYDYNKSGLPIKKYIKGKQGQLFFEESYSY